MDTPPLEILPALAEPLGVAALFALAIWAGMRIVLAGIAAMAQAAAAHAEAMARIEEARIGVQRAMADAVREQALAGGELARGLEGLRQEAAETGINLRVLIQRAGAVRPPDSN